MPLRDAAATWPLPKLDQVEIAYSTSDRFGEEEGFLEPHEEFAQKVKATVTGVIYADSESGRTVVPLGTLAFARIDLTEVGGMDTLSHVFDSHSREWNGYWDVGLRIFGESEDERADDFALADSLLLLDRLELVPEARGHGLGLHVLARAIRTWGGNAVVALTAWPPGDGDPRSDALGDEEEAAAGEALARYWSRLGFERQKDARPPVLVGFDGSLDFYETIVRYCQWHSPDEQA
jgi:hypothetical protein